jgi:hypothetical protein
VVKIISKVLLPGLLIPLLLVSTKQDIISQVIPRIDNFAFIENQLLSSSRYTQVDENDPIILDRFNEQFQLRYTQSELTALGFEKMLENNNYRLYFEKDSFSLIIEDKTTGYMFSSRPEFQGYSQSNENNNPTRHLMNSGLWIESIRTNNVVSSGIKTESIYSIANPSYLNNNSQNLSAIDWTSPYILTPNTYKRNLVSVTTAMVDSDRFRTNVTFTNYGFNFEVDIYLSSFGFGIEFDPATLVENNDQYRLLSLQFFPYFGSAREDVFPGYMVIPDGVGALIRTNQQYETSFQSDYFGSDLGYLRSSISQLTLPLYGLIHRPNAFGFFNEIISGEEHSTLLANFWRTTNPRSRYHQITNRYNLRRIYRNIINRAGDGNDVIPEEINVTPYISHYQILTEEKATYVGIANQFQHNLYSQGKLSAIEPTTTPLHLAMIMNEQEPTVFGTSRITLTNPIEAKEISESLNNKGITEQVLVLKGWSNDGLSYRQPYQFNSLDLNGLNPLIQYAKEAEYPLYLEQDYLVSSELSKRVNFNQDVARNYSKLKMSYPLNRLDNQAIDEYYLYPEKALSKLNQDLPFIESVGVTGLAMPKMGQHLYSYYDQSRVNRSNSKTILQMMAAKLPAIALHQPNAFLFPYLSHYLDMPITNSQLDLYSDLVPLIPLVMKGYIPAFTPYLNFNALGKDRLLQMIDFGINPSYLLTEAPSSTLRYTYSNRYYTTAYTDFETDIVNVYDYVAKALNPTLGSIVVSREMLTTGVSCITYKNGVKIYVNYRSDNFISDDGVVNPLDYLVVSR